MAKFTVTPETLDSVIAEVENCLKQLVQSRADLAARNLSFEMGRVTNVSNCVTGMIDFCVHIQGEIRKHTVEGAMGLSYRTKRLKRNDNPPAQKPPRGKNR